MMAQRSAAPRVRHAATVEALRFTDLTLRAGGDGAAVRVLRGVLCEHSRVIGELLAATTPSAEEEITLPGRTADELELLVAWMYRTETFTAVRSCAQRVARNCGQRDACFRATSMSRRLIARAPLRSHPALMASRLLTCCIPLHAHKQENVARACAMAREYDIPRLMETAETWLVDALARGTLIRSLQSRDMQLVRLISLVREYKLRRFAQAINTFMDKLQPAEVKSVLRAKVNDALK